MKIKLLILFLLFGSQLFGQNCCDLNNLFSNGGFESTSAPPTNGSDDLDLASNWIYIWEGGRAEIYNENTPNGGIGVIPGPQDGNYASCWIDNRTNAEQIWREGFMNQLSTIILPNSGIYNFSFEMANLYGFGTSEVGIYGIYNPNNNSVNSSPTGNFTPSNLSLFGTNNSVLLGAATVPAVSSTKQQYDIQINTNSNLFPSTGISHIMITHSDNQLSGGNYVAFDNFCISENDLANIEFVETYQSTEFLFGQEFMIYCNPPSIILDGSNSEYEDSYSIDVTSFNVINWSNGPVVYNSGLVSGQVPNNLDISNEFNWALNTVYRVKLTTYPCIDEDSIFFMVVEPYIDLPSTYISCDGVFEEICTQSGPNYAFEWYGTLPGGNTNELLWEDQCFTPDHTGEYTLFVTDDHGCTNSHTVSVLDEIPLPILAEGDQICAGEIISIDGQGFDNPSYAINWYHNGNLVQTGGTTLLTSFESGLITVEILIDGCETVSTQVYIKECCPKNVYLSVDCERQQIIIENLPSSIAGYGITSWTFNGNHISPQQLYDTEFDVSLGDGVYGVTILFQLDNGEKCKYKLSIVYKEANCCDEFGPIANAHFVNVEEIQQTFTDPYGNVDIPILCDFILDASNSICDEEYTFNISELDPLTWTTNEIFPWTYFSGPAGTIDLAQFANFIPGQAYLLAFNVGPNGTSVYLPFIYGLDAEVEIMNISGYISTPGTQYGDLEVPIVNCGLRLDGSASSCENSYQIIIESFDPNTWSTTSVPGEIYNVWTSGQAPSTTIIPPGVFTTDGYYLLTFAVGPFWTPEYVLIYYNCDNKKGSSKISSRFESYEDNNPEITLYPNPTNDILNVKSNFNSGTYQLYDVQGKLISQDILTSRETSIDLSRLNTGIYFFRIQTEGGEVYYEKVIKN